MTGNGETDRSFFSKNEPHHVDAKMVQPRPMQRSLLLYRKSDFSLFI